MSLPDWQTNRRRQMRTILWAVIGIGLLASLWSAANRWKAESRNHRVEITVDFNEMEKLAGATGQPILSVLQQFKNVGVSSIAVQEDTLATLEEQRLISTQQTFGESGFSVFLTSNPTVASNSRLKTVQDAIKHKIGTPVSLSLTEGSLHPLDINGPFNVLRGIGIGLNPQTVDLVEKQAGLNVVGRVSNYNGVRLEGIRWALDGLSKQGVKTVIFSGDEMLGFKGYLTSDPTKPNEVSTAKVLSDDGLNVGIVEFGKQKGEMPFVKSPLVQDRLIRVHTVTGAEMVQADIRSNVQRFLLAARERNIRLLFVRLFLDEKDPLPTNLDYIKDIAEGLTRGQLETGIAHGYGPLTTPLYLRAGIGLGLAAAWLLFWDSITWLYAYSPKAKNPPILAIVPYILALVPLGLPVVGLTGAKLAALFAGCLFPTLAIVHRDYLEPTNGKNATGTAFRNFAEMCAITLVGIASVVGLLADRIFLVKADAFIGVKATLIVPLLIIAVVYGQALRASRQRSFPKAFADMVERLGDLIRQPLIIWQVLLSVVTLAAFALIVLRSGNDPGIGVSSFELKIRGILDALLYARPRFKEMFGHAVMLLGLIFAAQGKRQWALPLLIVGTVGQASLLNTFCHLHTPLQVGLWRAGLGILFGAFFGFTAYLLYTAIDRPRKRKHVA